MKPTTSNWEDFAKLIDGACSDQTGADKPYKEHCEKWGKILEEVFNTLLASERKKWLEEVLPREIVNLDPLKWCLSEEDKGWNACRDEIIKRGKKI